MKDQHAELYSQLEPSTYSTYDVEDDPLIEDLEEEFDTFSI